MIIPTEPIGSIPRPLPLVAALAEKECDDAALDPLYEAAIRDTIARFEATGSPVITDGEQRKYHNFGTYCVEGMPNLAPDGFMLPFVSHSRRWPRLTSGPFRYQRSADTFLEGGGADDARGACWKQVSSPRRRPNTMRRWISCHPRLRAIASPG